MKILYAEDDTKLGSLVVTLLQKEGIEIDWVQTGTQAYEQAFEKGYDILLLDWMMPGYSGLEVCTQLRAANYPGKILLLTAKDTIADKVSGLTQGADDYLVKPFDFAELLARLQALSRRGMNYCKDEVTFQGLTLNRITQALHYGTNYCQLSNKEFALLDLFLSNPSQVLPRNIIMDKIWGLSGDISDNALDAQIKLLRKKISSLQAPVTLQNIRGVGYQLRGEKHV